jgi:hypothetical protein
LKDRPVLLVAAERDGTAMPLLHHRPLVEAFGKAGARALTADTFDDDHHFSATRIRLAQTMVAWLESVCHS